MGVWKTCERTVCRWRVFVEFSLVAFRAIGENPGSLVARRSEQSGFLGSRNFWASAGLLSDYPGCFECRGNRNLDWLGAEAAVLISTGFPHLWKWPPASLAYLLV